MEYVNKGIEVSGPRNKFSFSLVLDDTENFIRIDKSNTDSFSSYIILPVRFWSQFKQNFRNALYTLREYRDNKAFVSSKSEPVKCDEKRTYFFDIGKTNSPRGGLHLVVKESIFMGGGKKGFSVRKLYIFDDEVEIFDDGLSLFSLLNKEEISTLCPKCQKDMIIRDKPVFIVFNNIMNGDTSFIPSITSCKYFCPNCRRDYAQKYVCK